MKVLLIAGLVFLSFSHRNALGGSAGIEARFIRVIKTDDTINPADANRFHIGEIEAFLFGVTPAAGLDNANDQALGTIPGVVASTLSGTAQHGADTALISGVASTANTTWSRQDPLPIIAQVDLGSTLTLGEVRVWQRADICCQDRLEGFTLELLADDGGVPGGVVFSEDHPERVPLNSYSSFFTTTMTGIVWTGSADNSSWNLPGNWDLGRVPTTNDTAIFEGATPGTTVDLAGTRTVNDVIFQADARDFILANGTLLSTNVSHVSTGTNMIDATVLAGLVSVSIGQLTLEGQLVTPGQSMDLSVAGELVVHAAVSGSGEWVKQGGGTVVLTNPANSFSGELLVNGGVVQVRDTGVLGDTNGITRIGSQGTLELAGGIDYLTPETLQFVDGGVLLNGDGTNTLAALLQGRITTRTEAGTMLSLLGDLNLHEELLCVDGEGETVLSGNLTGDDPGLNGLDLLPTGDYEVEPAGTNLTLHIDHDGLHGWLLIGRGRQGWEFDADGQGAVSNVYQHLGTTNAFAPAVYSEALINDALRRAGLRADQLEIRIRRASDPAGTVYQEVRWLPVNQDVWHWDLDINPGRLVRMEIQSGSPGGLLRNHLANTRDVGANDHTRVFTWAWDGHANQKGFSYGGAVTNGVNGNTSFLWEAGNENHAMPYAEVYIRSVARAAGLVKKGNGTLTLSGDNAYATETCIEAGRVVLASNLALGASVTPTIVEAGAELALSGNGLYTVQEPLILDVMGSGGALVNLDGTNAYSGTISLAPLKPAIRSGFTGGDLGEGLDLDGNFVHAVNVRGPGGLQVRDALFAADTNVTGVVVQASREILNWQNPVLGDSGDDDNLEVVMQSIRWGNSETYGGIVHVAFSDLVPAVNYRLQLLFFEPTNPNRGYDVLFDGVCIYNDFTAGLGGNQGAVLTYDFMATQSNHAVILEGRGAPFVDSAPILQGLTLERDIPIARAPGHAVARVEAGTLILNGSVDLDGSELELAGAGDHQVDVALGGFGAESLRKSGGGTAVLNGVNTFMGEVVVEEGALVVTRNDSLGSMLGGTRVDPAGLLVLDGGPLSINEDLTLSGTLLNLAGTNTVLASAQVQAPPYLPGPLRIDVADGRLDVLPDVNLEVRDLVVDGAGDLLLDGAIHIYTGPITPSLNVLDTLVPGNYPFTAAGESFLGYVDHDGSDAWLLIGRGREGWEFDADGQGAITNVYQGLETTNAFAPAVYSEAVINELLAQSGVTMADIEVRIKRAADIDGLTYQESRWRDFQTAQWTWALNQNPVGLAVAYEILSGPGAGFVDLTSSTLDAWTLPGNAGNDATRLFTWAWGGHGSLQGFSYGGSVQGVDNNSPSTFMWEFAVEGHALPYSEIYIRSRRAVPFTIGSSLTKHGAGRLTLSAANEFLGDTIVHAGDLQVNNPSGSGTGSGMVLVAAGAGLGGSGSVSGPVTLTSGALLSPGNVIGTFTANGGLNVATPGAATTVTIELASPVLADQLAISGSVALQNMTLDVETVMGFTPTGSVTYTILTTSGGVTGTFDGLSEGATVDVGGTPFTIQYTGNDVVLTSGGTVPDGPLGLSVVRTSPGVYDVSFMGEATTPYTIEFTETLSPPSWQTIGAVQSDGTGLYGLQHTFSGPRGYYRSTFP